MKKNVFFFKPSLHAHITRSNTTNESEESSLDKVRLG